MTNLNQQEMARQVLGYYNLEGGWQPGGFTSKLITAYVGADFGNKAKLASVFPEMAAAMRALDLGEASLYAMAWPTGDNPVCRLS